MGVAENGTFSFVPEGKPAWKIFTSARSAIQRPIDGYRPLFYRLFKTSPETLFLVLGMSAESASDMAAKYEYDAIEFKETSHRVDGIFRPNEPGLPLYVVEVQFYYLPSVYADLLVKAYTYLKQHDPARPFLGIVLFAERKFEPEELTPYKALIEAGVIRRYYLEEVPEIANAPLGLSILYLIRQTEAQAPVKARELISRTKTEIGDEAQRADLIELIETIIMYKLPHLSPEEIQAMLQVDDIRKTRVFREAKEEGLKEGIELGKLRAVAALAALKMSAERIAETLELDIQLVRKEMMGRNGDNGSRSVSI